MKPKNLNECVIGSKISDGGCFLGKNRDRSYNPNVEIIHGVYPKIEYVIIHDTDTGYMEGVNATSGYAILNSALLNGADFGKNKSDEGKNLVMALLNCFSLESIIDSLTKKYPVYGNSIIATRDSICILECTPEKAAYKEYTNVGDYVARSNHGVLIPDVGYRPKDTEDYLSSMTRLAASEIIIDGADSLDEFLSGLCYPLFGKYGAVNTSRESDYLYTTAQIGIDFQNKIFKFSGYPDKSKFKGIRKLGDKSIESQYRIIIEEPSKPTNIPFLTWGYR